MIALATLIVLSCLLGPARAGADERAKMLWSRGLIELQAERYSVALDLFQQAVDADPNDVQARYYRAVARARLGDRKGAIADLRDVLKAEPDFAEAALDLGVALIEEQQYAEALPWLRQAQRSPPLAARASLFIGIAQLRDKQLMAAQESFGRVADDPEHGMTARYYAGVVEYQLGNLVAAKAAFTAVVQAQPDSAIGREAQRFLDVLQATSGRWYTLSAGLGLSYDSNVILSPSVGGAEAQNVLGVSQKSDGEATIQAGAVVVPWQRGGTALSLGYNFFQSYHFELVEFDLQAHTVTGQVAGERGLFRFGAVGRYDYELLDTQSFLQAATGSPWLTILTGDIGRLVLFYRLLWSDYKDRDFSVRNSFNHAVGATQFFQLGSRDRVLSLGYQFDFEDPDIDPPSVDAEAFVEEAESFGYHGNEVNVGAFWLFPLDIGAEARFAYRHEAYAEESEMFTDSGTRRRDDDFLFSLLFRRRIWDGINAIVAYFGDFNDSNAMPFDYDRHVVSIGVEARY